MPEPLPPDEFAMLELPRAPAPKLPAEPGLTFSTECRGMIPAIGFNLLGWPALSICKPWKDRKPWKAGRVLSAGHAVARENSARGRRPA